MNEDTQTSTIESSARLAVLVTLIVVVTAMTATVFVGSVAANEPETANEYFDEFRAMEGTEAYDEYDEFETIRTFAVTQVQESGTLDADEQGELEAVHQTMIAFEQAYEHAEDGDYEESLAYAEQADDHIDALEEYEQTQATLADLAVTRFYEGLAGGLHDEAEAADRTPDRLELLSLTATTYERANMPDEAAEFNLQFEQETAAYDTVREQITTAEDNADAFFEDCADCTDVGSAVAGAPNPLDIFESYQEIRSVNAEIGDAHSVAASHGLEEREEELAALDTEVGNAYFSFAIASTSVLVGYGMIVGLLGTILLGRIFVWKRTYDTAQIGSIVTVGDDNV